jgi:hypothetical protein
LNAIGQFGGNMLKGQAASQALANINMVSPLLSGLGVDPLSANALSNGIKISANEFSIATDPSELYFTNTAIGTAFGAFGDKVSNFISIRD